MKIMLFITLIICSSCSYLLSPPAIIIEEEIAIEAMKLIEHDLDQRK